MTKFNKTIFLAIHLFIHDMFHTFEETHYCGLQSQSNIYGLAQLSPTNMANSTGKVLVASTRGKVLSLEFQKTTKSTPSSKEIHFTYIPGDAEIVSIDAFTKPLPNQGFVVGITIIKSSERRRFLNIYSQWEPGASSDLDRIAQACDNHELNYIPYQLLHAQLTTDFGTEIVFLLSGSDRRMHIYRESRVGQEFEECLTEECFPEFTNIKSSITWASVKSLPDQQRLTAYGCESGTVNVTLVDVEKKEILSAWTVQHDGPITAIEIFTLNNAIPCPNMVPEDLLYEDKSQTSQDLHLLVADALEVTVIYRNVLTNGLDDSTSLLASDQYDSVLCCCITDIDFDGQKEILLGTYGQELLAYKLTEKTPSPSHSFTDAEGKSTNPVHQNQGAHKVNIQDGEFKLQWRRSFAYPILSLCTLDITGDGVQEIMVLSLQGLHVLKQNAEDVASVCLQRLKLLSHSDDTEEDDIFQQLQSEHFGEPEDT